MTIFSRIKTRINRSKRYVFTRADFGDIGSYSQIGKSLNALISEGALLRIAYGLYTKARINRITGNIMPSSPGGLDGVIFEVFEKLGVSYQLDDFSQLYLDGKSTQIPASIQFITDKNRFTRKIVVGNKAINVS
ncbi:MAG: hypothetical protein ACI8WB_001897 [Phenylobacterium sp.]